jgi:MFS family permease
VSTPTPAGPAPPEHARASLPATVIGLGLVSLFTDASSEAIFPLLPAFLVSLGASGTFIGLIEGTADLVANLLKYGTGFLADRRARLKPLVLAGYGLSTVVRPLVAFAAAPWHVLLVRIGDRVGKGVRTSPRDALIAAVTDPSIRARAYGFHRAMDHAGAVLGTLLGASLLWLLGATAEATPGNAARMRTVFLWAAVPGALALLSLALTAEPRRAPAPAEARAVEPMPPLLRRALLALVLFSFANATDAFLLVQAARLGASPVLAPVLWLVLHVVKASTGTAGGRLADAHGRRNALVLGWCVYSVLWSAIGFAASLPALFALTAAYGVTHGLVEGAERALVAELAPAGRKGTAFGVYNMAMGLSALAASTAFGAVLDRWGSVAAFTGSGAFALVAAGALLALVPGHAAPGRYGPGRTGT